MSIFQASIYLFDIFPHISNVITETVSHARHPIHRHVVYNLTKECYDEIVDARKLLS